MRNPKLWKDLYDHDFHAEFRDRMIRDLAWVPTSTAAAAALGEYRRYLYLASITDETLPPSPRIAEVWALHRTFEGYEKLPLPKEIRPVEASDSLDAPGYKRTLRLYQAEFDRDPPSAYWLGTGAPDGGTVHRSGGHTKIVVGGMLVTWLGIGLNYFAETSSMEFGGLSLAIFGVIISLWPLYATPQGRKLFFRHLFESKGSDHFDYDFGSRRRRGCDRHDDREMSTDDECDA